MGKPKKRSEEFKLKYVYLVFRCPNGHTISHRVEIVQSSGTSKILDAIKFPVRCLECGWEGEIQGSQRIDVLPAEPN
jgi:hypothetical protein